MIFIFWRPLGHEFTNTREVTVIHVGMVRYRGLPASVLHTASPASHSL